MPNHINKFNSHPIIVFVLFISCSARHVDWDCSGISMQNCNNYQKDFLAIVHTIVKNHPGMNPDPLQFVNIDSIFTLFCTTYKSLEQIKSNEEFFFLVSKLLNCLNDGHTSLRWNEINNTESLPFDLGWFQDSLYIMHVHNKIYDSLQYASIIDLNGYPINQIETMANSYLFSDFKNSLVKRLFSPCLVAKKNFLKHSGVIKLHDTLKLRYIKNRTTGLVLVSAFNLIPCQTSMYHARNEITTKTNVNKFAMLKECQTLYLQINDMPIFGRSTFYRNAFTEAKKWNAKHVVVDMRNCGGGWSGWSDELMRYIVKTPRQLRNLKKWKKKGNVNILFDKGYMNVKPAMKSQSFEGKVIVLAGPNTTSSAMHIVTAIKDNQLGIVIGEQCGNNLFRYGEYKSLKLPNTGMEFRYSTKIYAPINHSADEYLNKMVPDIYVDETIGDLIDKRDPVWDYAIKIITNDSLKKVK